MSDFLHMGGYGAYVWSCYGLTAAVLVLLAWSSRRRFKTALVTATRRVAAAGQEVAS